MVVGVCNWHLARSGRMVAPAKSGIECVNRFVWLIIPAVAFWPVWIWFAQRTIDRSDEPLGVLAIITLLVVFSRRSNDQIVANPNNASMLLICLIVIYSLIWFGAPHLVQGVIAVLGLGMALSLASRRFNLFLGDWLLLLLSLPLVSSLNFYIGYPVRVLVSRVAAPWISMTGFPCTVEGTSILWNASVVEIDAPCSGIKMLWFALYMAAALSSLWEFDTRRTLLIVFGSLAGAFFANILRVCSLFYVEADVFHLNPNLHDVMHQGIGVSSFLLLALAIVLAALQLHRLAARKVGDQTGSITSESVGFQPAINLSDTGRGMAPPLRISLILCTIVAACVPIVLGHQGTDSMSRNFPGWPKQFEGLDLKPIPATPVQEQFMSGFPGRIAAFTAGSKTVVLRYIEQPTRQLHASSDCYRGAGYSIHWLPIVTEKDGTRWSSFRAEKGAENQLVRERIFDGKGSSWTDVSAWYWATVMRQTSKPWWGFTVSERSLAH